MQELLWTAEEFATIIESAVALAFVVTISGNKYHRLKHFLYILIFSFMLSLLITALNFITLFSYITPIIAMSFIVFFSSKALSTGTLLVRSYACLLAYILIQTLDYIIVVIMSFFVETNGDLLSVFGVPGWTRVLFLIFDKSADIVALFLLKNQLPKLRSISTRKQFAVLILSAIAYAFMQFLFSSVVYIVGAVYQLVVIVSWIFLICFISAMLAFLLSSTRAEQDKQMKDLLAAENKMMTENYRQMHLQQQAYARDFHDIKHHLSAIKGLAMKTDDKTVTSYVDSLLENSFSNSSKCNSGNDIIDAVINCKISEAERANIDFKFVANLHDPVHIDPVDLCGVLANQIDNAFDACLKIDNSDNRHIYVEVTQREDFVILKVRNSTDHNPLENNQELKTTKKDGQSSHGYGIKSIQYVTDKYNGILRNEYQDGLFISVATLCQKPFDT